MSKRIKTRGQNADVWKAWRLAPTTHAKTDVNIAMQITARKVLGKTADPMTPVRRCCAGKWGQETKSRSGG